MNEQAQISIGSTGYDREKCRIGIVHLGFGAFHRAHQAVYVDDYMEKSGDLNWGIAAVNLRAEDRADFEQHKGSNAGYLLKTASPNGEITLREVRSHVRFEDWSTDQAAAEALLCLDSVKVVSITVTESGYCLNDDGSLNASDPVIAAEVAGREFRSVYAYLASALKRRMKTTASPVTIVCCDNIRSNGEKLGRNFRTYLELTGQLLLATWLDENATFPNSMVDRITPRATELLRSEVSVFSPKHSKRAIHSESFVQWVMEDNFATEFPRLDQVGVEFVDDVDPYEEAKIRILNGGHTALCYLGALAGHRTFDQAMLDPQLRLHFDRFEIENVLPGLNLELPFDKVEYLEMTAARFSNAAMADHLERICMDGWSKFPIFIRPTIESCLEQGIDPVHAYDSIASWYVYARRYSGGHLAVSYQEPYWDVMVPFLAEGRENDFAQLEALWSDLPSRYEAFVPGIVSAIKRMEARWPI